MNTWDVNIIALPESLQITRPPSPGILCGVPIEKVQRRCLRLSRDQTINMESLHERQRRKKTELVDTYKFITGRYKTPADKYFSLPHKQWRNQGVHAWALRPPMEVIFGGNSSWRKFVQNVWEIKKKRIRELCI